MSEFENFTALLSKIVRTPRAIVQKREQEEQELKDWRKPNSEPMRRNRLKVVCPDSVGGAKLH